MQRHALMEMEMDFRPLQHPMEPLDEDRPIKCPMSSPSSSSSFNDGKKKEGEEERVAAEIGKIRSEQPLRATGPPLKAARKRQHTLAHDGAGYIIMKPFVRMPPRLSATQNLTIFQMLQEFDELDGEVDVTVFRPF